MEINLSPEVLKKWGAILLIILALAGGAYYLFDAGVFDNALEQNDVSIEDVDTGVIASVGAEVYFTLDYKEEDAAAAWLRRYCEISTESGCGYADAVLLETMNRMAESKHAETSANVLSVENVDSGLNENGTSSFFWEVWLVNVKIDNPIEGQNSKVSIYVMVANKDGGEWKFDRVLSREESTKYKGE